MIMIKHEALTDLESAVDVLSHKVEELVYQNRKLADRIFDLSEELKNIKLLEEKVNADD